MTFLIDAKPNLDLETVSTCNRFCSTCLRNSYPNKGVSFSWFKKMYLPEGLIYQAIEDALKLEFFSGTVCLNHYNEPLMDERIVDISKNIKNGFSIRHLYLHSNGDLLTEEIASKLDGALDRIIFTLYMDEPVKSSRVMWIRSLFSKTDVIVNTYSKHIATHFSPDYPVDELAEKNKTHTCFEPHMRIVINHRRQYLLCCDDFVGHFDLGTFPEKSLAEHWEEKMKIQQTLSVPNGRLVYTYCTSCPRS